MGAEFSVTLMEGTNESLSNELSIGVCISFFKGKKFFFEFSLFTFLEISHAWRGGLGFNLIF